MRNDVVAKTLYNAIRRTDSPEDKNIRNYSDIEGILTQNMKEYWWNVLAKTSVKCRNNGPDIMVWDREKKESVRSCRNQLCTTDVNILLKIREKENIYAELMKNLEILHQDYNFRFVPVIMYL